ncbi:hypothetical protein B0H15DRAFT_949540 [Mycena belliarum]|uniref:Uncharacterized protein n=1 Tax=Mycena belliarum TaxID=1033014 RepID=A0AAD6XLW4_9AGAR|nr:hypothetical protein B0H15DRAFT_949540 [Mycena belliae]
MTILLFTAAFPITTTSELTVRFGGMSINNKRLREDDDDDHDHDHDHLAKRVKIAPRPQRRKRVKPTWRVAHSSLLQPSRRRLFAPVDIVMPRRIVALYAPAPACQTVFEALNSAADGDYEMPCANITSPAPALVDDAMDGSYKRASRTSRRVLSQSGALAKRPNGKKCIVPNGVALKDVTNTGRGAANSRRRDTGGDAINHVARNNIKRHRRRRGLDIVIFFYLYTLICFLLWHDALYHIATSETIYPCLSSIFSWLLHTRKYQLPALVWTPISFSIFQCCCDRVIPGRTGCCAGMDDSASSFLPVYPNINVSACESSGRRCAAKVPAADAPVRTLLRYVLLHRMASVLLATIPPSFRVTPPSPLALLLCHAITLLVFRNYAPLSPCSFRTDRLPPLALPTAASCCLRDTLNSLLMRTIASVLLDTMYSSFIPCDPSFLVGPPPLPPNHTARFPKLSHCPYIPEPVFCATLFYPPPPPRTDIARLPILSPLYLPSSGPSSARSTAVVRPCCGAGPFPPQTPWIFAPLPLRASQVLCVTAPSSHAPLGHDSLRRWSLSPADTLNLRPAALCVLRKSSAPTVATSSAPLLVRRSSKSTSTPTALDLIYYVPRLYHHRGSVRLAYNYPMHNYHLYPKPAAPAHNLYLYR